METIVPLTASQLGFLWLSLEQGGNGAIVQLRFTIKGKLDPSDLKAAWKTMVARHQSLRSSVHWDNVKQPLQVVHKQVSLHWIEQDLRSLKNPDEAVDNYLAQDRLVSFDLTTPGGDRIALMRTSDDSTQCIWTLSHVLLDGWSCAIFINQLLETYHLRRNMGLTETQTPVLSLQDLVRLDKQARPAESLAYWAEYFSKALESSNVKVDMSSTVQHRVKDQANPSRAMQSLRFKLSAEDTAALERFLREKSVTLSSVLQCVWSSLMRKNGSDWVSFGLVISGREINARGIEHHVGMLMKVLPVCVQFDLPDLDSWLQSIQRRFFSSLEHQGTEFKELQDILPEDIISFGSALVIENYPSIECKGDLQIEGAVSDIVSGYNLTAVVISGKELSVELRYRSEQWTGDTMRLLADSFKMKVQYLLQQNFNELREAIELPPYFHDMDSGIEASGGLLGDTGTNDFQEVLSTRLERELLEIWSKVFPALKFGYSDSFFDLGGSSLQAVMIFQEMQRRFNVLLPTTQLFKTPTIAGLVDAMRNEDPLDAWSTTIDIKRSGCKLPLFIPIMSVNMLMFRNLASLLDTEQPVIGLRAYDPNSSTSELVTKLVSSLKLVQPKGPYRIGGLSGAGMIAWRMAQQLRKQGDEVALLVLIDSYGPDYPKLQQPVRRLASFYGYFFNALCVHVVRFVRNRLSPLVSAKEGISNILVRSDMELRHDHRIKEAKDYSNAYRFVRSVNRRQKPLDKIVNNMILQISCLRFRSFSMRVPFIVLLQGLWLEYANKRIMGDRDATDSELVDYGRQYSKLYDGLNLYDGEILYIMADKRPPGVVEDDMFGWSSLVKGRFTLRGVPSEHTSMLDFPGVIVAARALQERLDAVAAGEV